MGDVFLMRMLPVGQSDAPSAGMGRQNARGEVGAFQDVAFITK